MKTCQTCGKILKDSMEEFTVNGILQCENCAYPNNSTENDTKKESDKVSNSWISILKTVSKINIIVGIIASLALGICVYQLIYSDAAIIFAGITFITGVILTILSEALTMVFVELAEDISIIRYIINKK